MVVFPGECSTNAITMGKNDGRNFRLQIQTKLSDHLFTGKKLEGERGARISVALIDANTQDIVRSGLESSIKLDVVVLEGDFNKDDEDNWTQEEFENYVVKEREGKGSLLTGDLHVTLKGGVGELGELIFTDNSSWNRNKSFRIGLKVASSYCGNTRIREAKTNAFRVKEHRGESSKKHYPPAFDDDIWRLEKIAKDGRSHQKLMEAGIHKVEDFLQHLFTDSKKLREVRTWLMILNYCLTDYQERQIENFPPVPSNLAPQICAAPGGPEPPLANMGLTAEGHNGGSALAWTGQSQNTNFRYAEEFPVEENVLLTAQQHIVADQNANFGNDMDISFDEGVPPASHQPISADQNVNFGNTTMFVAYQPNSADNLNVLIPPRDNSITSVGSPNQSHDINIQYEMGNQKSDPWSPVGYLVNEHVLSSGPTDASISSCQYGSTCPLPKELHEMEKFQSTMADDMMELWNSGPGFV
ncbi:hypothetical protein BT93_E2203 [Corymbia citriodora subsp. variegata]|nr:hypothetical protein BT93_E2203 [Corymbia citriodora subsp. variegata]